MTKLAIVVLLLAACKSEEDYKKQKPPEPEPVVAAEKKPMPPPRKELKPEEMGQCTLKLSGAMTKEQTTMGGRAATNVTYWYGESEKNNMMAMDGFAVNCHGPDIKFSIVPGGGKPDGMPFAPKKYEFKKGAADGAGVNITLGPTLTFGDPSGTVNITAFDKRHIAGTIDLSGKLMGKGAKGAVKLTGQFDFVCPGFSGCEI
ncbi:MAG TPA: hypothetical protein VIV11_41955 [Kofleriaceae bacterium]